MRAPLYRRSFDTESLRKKHPPKFQHAYKQSLYDLAYLEAVPTFGPIIVSRWDETLPVEVSLDNPLAIDVRPGFFDYEPMAPDSVEWHVNFADPRLFFAYGSSLFAQDEMQVAEHSILGSVREALLAENLEASTCDQSKSTPILIQNVERRLEILTNPDAHAGRPQGLYGNRFASASFDVIRRATKRIDPPTISHIIAMAAPSYGRGIYSRSTIESIFATAFTAFSAASQESIPSDGNPRKVIIHTGFWGCGAFGGNRTLMIALQILAARSSGIEGLVLHAGDRNGVIDVQRGMDIAEIVEARCGNKCALSEMVSLLWGFEFQWGVSDGN